MSRDELIALEPCPFCGDQPEPPKFVYESGSKDVWEVECGNCIYSIEGPRADASTARAAAAERWNTRPAKAGDTQDV